MKKLTAIAGIAGIGAMALLCSGEASANTTMLRSSIGNSPYADTGVTPALTSLNAVLILNGSGSVNDIVAPSNSGFYSTRLATLCPGNTTQDNTTVGSGTLFFDLVHLCGGGFQAPLFIGGIIDDL